MKNNTYGLLGKRLSHSISPFIHNMLGNKQYNLYEIEENEVDDFLKNNTLSGFNVTIPYKLNAYKECSVLSDTAKKTGNVNTVISKPDGIYGYNTDYDGFHQMCINNGCSFKNKKVIILGSGGASKTIQAVVKDNNCSSCTVISRTGKNNYSSISQCKNADILINATPVGMYPEINKSPVDLNVFDKLEYVIDIIYNPIRTRLILQAQSLQIKTISGLEMLVNQAIKSDELFFGIKRNSYNEIYTKSKNELQNISFVGMPGCGKTTIGKIFSKELGYNFVDTDNIIETRYAKPSKIINEKGEEYFRLIEKEIIEEVCKEHKQVISTGGGSVILQENRLNIMSNSIVIYLKKDINELELTDRPLSDTKDKINALFNERDHLYRSIADIEVTVKNTPEETVRYIRKCISL